MKGLPIWIAGSGPTLGDHDLGAIRKQHIFALNSAIQFFTKPKAFRDTWWMWWDARTYRECFQAIDGWDVLKAIVHKQGLEMMRSLRRPGRYVEFLKANYHPERTVLETALLIARFLEPSEVYLVGCDGMVARDGKPYAEGLEWKPCHFMDVARPDSYANSSGQFVDAIEKLVPRLGGLKVYQTSDIYPADTFERISFDEAADRSKGALDAASKPRTARKAFR